MIRLNKTQLAGKVKFITDYINASNAADGSTVDPNSNVATKNIATMSAEINKDINIQIKRQLIYDKLIEIFGQKQADKYIDQLEKHEIYAHDESGLMPYTYMAQETVLVRYKGRLLNTSFEDLYELVDCNEYLEDEDKNVWCKYPDDLWIKDRKDETKITRLVKKERHRDLVRVKTKYGEDIFVTDNHPLIISDDKNNTIDAIDSLNKEQYRIKTKITEGNIDKLFVKDFMKKNLTVYENYVCYEPSNYKKVFSHKTINLSEKFGYFIGIFIAEGWYVGSPNQPYDKIMIKMKDKSILNTLCDYLYESTGIYSYVSELSNQRGFYTLQINNQILVNLLLNEFKIYPTAQNKTLPINIYEYNIDFIKGVLAGLIDGDGCVTKTGQFNIRVASRKLISQLQYLLQYLGYSCSTTYQDVTYKETDLIKSSYPVFGIASYVWNDSITLPLCTKLANCEIKTKGKRYYSEEWSNIDSVTLVTNNKLLEANKFIYDITTNSNTFNLNNIWVHNCAAISMYPFLQNGLQDFGGESKAPKHLSSFNGGFINLMFALSSQFCGAVATVEYLMCFDYFARKDYGDDYLEDSKNVVKQELQQVVYALNQPASARGFQSCFWNISIFDKYYFKALFENFSFPDGSKPEWESLDKLQRFFMKWFNQERTKALLTFPVVTVSVLNNGIEILDTEYRDLISTELSEGNSFFIYTSKSVDSLSSCCRLRNSIADQINDFSYSLGAGGVMTGSINVITLNMNRFVQNILFDEEYDEDKHLSLITSKLRKQIRDIHKYQVAVNALFEDFKNKGMLPAYTANFISLEKQYRTIGINGLVEAAEYLGYEANNNTKYKNFVSTILKTISDVNKDSGYPDAKFNTELVPAENLGVKFAKWDNIDQLVVTRDCYNSYLYPVENEELSIIDKFALHGDETTQYLDGGSALHLNLEDTPTKETCDKLLAIAVKTGCNYFCLNVKVTICNDCNHIDKQTNRSCTKCGSKNIDYATRVIGYLRRVTNFSKERQTEEQQRYYHKE